MASSGAAATSSNKAQSSGGGDGSSSSTATPTLQDPTEAHTPRRVETSRAGDGLWLVKVPKYLAELWARAEGDGQIGRLVVRKSSVTNRSEVTLITNDSLLAAANDKMIPKEHQFILKAGGVGGQATNAGGTSQSGGGKMAGPSSQDLSILCETREPTGTTSNLCLFGQVNSRAECRPPSDNKYMSLKREHMQTMNKPARQVKRLETHVRNYKPVNDHKNNIEWQQKLKTEGKNLRRDRDDVVQDLFKAFERHQYYNIRDLVNLTKQPVPYLKEILKDIASYNMRPPHKNMWELKPEYRHYRKDEEETAKNGRG